METLHLLHGDTGIYRVAILYVGLHVCDSNNIAALHSNSCGQG
jgi:hypothetical protein